MITNDRKLARTFLLFEAVFLALVLVVWYTGGVSRPRRHEQKGAIQRLIIVRLAQAKLETAKWGINPNYKRGGGVGGYFLLFPNTNFSY